MTNTGKPPRPRMQGGECVDVLSGKKLPESKCKTEGGSRKTKKTFIEDGKECYYAERPAQEIEKKGYNRDPYTRKPQKPHKRTTKSGKVVNVHPKQVPVKVKGTHVDPTSFEVEKKRIKHCSKIGGKK